MEMTLWSETFTSKFKADLKTLWCLDMWLVHVINQNKSCDWREGEGHQRSHHDDEVEDVPQVSEVGSIMEDQTLVNHLRTRQESAIK